MRAAYTKLETGPRSVRMVGYLTGLCGLFVWIAAGCAATPGPAEPDRTLQTCIHGPWSEAESRVRRDPLGYLKTVRERAAALEQYTVLLTRSERRGVLKRLEGPERIQCWFRREPFSVRLKWLDEQVKYGECVFVRGQHRDQVRFVPRNGFLGLPPAVVAVDVRVPVIWGEARNPLTDFGLENMLERTWRSIEEADGEVRITYHGVSTMDPPDTVAHHFTLEYPAEKFPQNIQELLIDPHSDLPLATKILYGDGRLDASYRYEQLDTTVQLSDADFVLEADRNGSTTASGGGSSTR